MFLNSLWKPNRSPLHTLLLLSFLSSLPSFLCLVLSCLRACQWPCLPPCGQLCHRWSITTGGGLLLAEPHGPADPDKSAVNASPQPNALIGSDRRSGPYASFMPPRPQKPGVGRYVCLRVCEPPSTTLFSTCCLGFVSLVSSPCSLGPTVHGIPVSWLCVCVAECSCTHVNITI